MGWSMKRIPEFIITVVMLGVGIYVWKIPIIQVSILILTGWAIGKIGQYFSKKK